MEAALPTGKKDRRPDWDAKHSTRQEQSDSPVPRQPRSGYNFGGSWGGGLDSFRYNQANAPGIRIMRRMNIIRIGLGLEPDPTCPASAVGLGVAETVGVGSSTVTLAVGVALAPAVGTGWVADF